MFGFSLEELAILALLLLAGGIFTGLLSGLLGIGGGAILVPVLYHLFELIGVPEDTRMHLSVGTSLAIIVPTSIRAYLSHKNRGSVDMEALRIWAVPTVVGVVLGTVIAANSSSGVLKVVFGIFAICIGIQMLFFGGRMVRIADDLPGRAGMSAYGLVIGLASSLMGVGGGAIGNMVFSLYGRPMHQGVGTSAGLGVLVSIPGAIGFMIAGWPEMAQLPPLSLGYVSIIGALLIAPISILAAPLGARIAHAFSPRLLQKGLGLFLITMGARFVLELATGLWA